MQEKDNIDAIDATNQYTNAINRNIELINQASLEEKILTAVSPERVQELASYGLQAKTIAHMLRQDYAFISRDPLLQQAFDAGKANIGSRIRAKLVDQALDKDNLTAMIHLDKALNSETQVQQIELSVKNDILKDVPTEDLIDIMYNKGETE